MESLFFSPYPFQKPSDPLRSWRVRPGMMPEDEAADAMGLRGQAERPPAGAAEAGGGELPPGLAGHFGGTAQSVLYRPSDADLDPGYGRIVLEDPAEWEAEERTAPPSLLPQVQAGEVPQRPGQARAPLEAPPLKEAAPSWQKPGPGQVGVARPPAQPGGGRPQAYGAPADDAGLAEVTMADRGVPVARPAPAADLGAAGGAGGGAGVSKSQSMVVSGTKIEAQPPTAEREPVPPGEPVAAEGGQQAGVPTPVVAGPTPAVGQEAGGAAAGPGSAGAAPGGLQHRFNRILPPKLGASPTEIAYEAVAMWSRDRSFPPQERQERIWKALRDSRAPGDHTSWTEHLSDVRRNGLLRHASQALGIPEKQVRAMLETERLLDWGQHESPTSGAIKSSWLYPMMTWAGLVKDVDLIRRLPDQTLIPNPQILGDRELFDAAIDDFEAPPQEKARLRSRWKEYHLAWLAEVLPTLGTMEPLPGVESYMEWRGKQTDVGDRSEEEMADLYLTQQRKRDGWVKLAENLATNLVAGTHDLVGGLAGAAAYISGSETMAEYAAEKNAEARRMTGALEHTGNGGFVNGVLGGVARAVPGLFAGAASGGVLSIAQGMGSTYTDVYSHYRAQRMTHEEAAKAAERAATIAGVISIVVSKIPGMRTGPGAGQVSQEAVRAEVQTALRSLASAAAKKGVQMSKEAVESMTEDLLEGALQHFNTGLNKGIPIGKLVQEYVEQLPQSVVTSGVMGAGQGMGRSGAPPGNGGGAGAVPDHGIPDTAMGGNPSAQGAGVPRLQFSQGGGQNEVAKPLTPGQVMQSWAREPGRFRRDPAKKDPDSNGPASASRDLDQIFSDYDLHKEKMFVEETKAFPDPAAAKVYHIGVGKGGNAYLYKGKDGTVWLDLKEMRSPDGGPVQGGDLVIQAAMTYAMNNGLRWRPDPLGSSEIAVTRGFSHMLSSALRHQSTQHLALNSTLDPATGRPAVRLPGWMDGNSREAYEHNVNLLATAEYEAVKAAAAKQGVNLEELDWDPETDTVTHGPTGRRLSKGDIKHLISRLDPGNSGVGETTLSRALGAQAALQGKIAGRSDLRRERHEVSDGGGGTFGEPGAALFRITTDEKALFYSKPGTRGNSSGGPTLDSHFGGDVGRLNQQVAETARLLHEKHPGLINDNTQVFHSADDLLNSDYAKQHPFTEEEKAGMRGAEGFFDASTGKTVIIAGNVSLRGGETPQSALTRVVLHERVGHDGLKLLLGGTDGKAGANRARWKEIQALIPEDQLKAIGNEKGYEHLRGNTEGQALEWFARRAESSPELLRKDAVMKQAWEKFTQIVQDFMARFGMDPLKGKDLDAQVMALLNRARQAAVKGGGGGSGAGSTRAAAPERATRAMAPKAADSSGAAPEPRASAVTPAGPAASLARAPLSVEGSRRLIANVSASAAQRPLHPVEQADLEQAQRIVAEAEAQATARKPAAKPSRAPLSMEGSRRLIANVMAKPERERQHPTVQADLAQAQAVVARAGMA